VKRKIVQNKIPKSEHGKIRALATYGMTIEQVATVYDVTIDTIEKIIIEPNRGRGRGKAACGA